jgi:hypothetical protein
MELLVSDNAAPRLPRAVGANTTLIAQLAPAARDEPQLFVCVKSEALVPLMLRLLMVRVALPVLVRVKLCAALLVPTNCGAKLSEVAE